MHHRIARIKNGRLKFGQFVGDDEDSTFQSQPYRPSSCGNGDHTRAVIDAPSVSLDCTNTLCPGRPNDPTCQSNCSTIAACIGGQDIRYFSTTTGRNNSSCFDETVDSYRVLVRRQADLACGQPPHFNNSIVYPCSSSSLVGRHQYSDYPSNNHSSDWDSIERTRLEIHQKFEIVERKRRLGLLNPKEGSCPMATQLRLAENEDERNRQRMEWRAKHLVQESFLMRAQSDLDATRQLIAATSASNKTFSEVKTDEDIVAAWERRRRTRCRLPCTQSVYAVDLAKSKIDALFVLEEEQRKEIELLQLTRLDALRRIMVLAIGAIVEAQFRRTHDAKITLPHRITPFRPI